MIGSLAKAPTASREKVQAFAECGRLGIELEADPLLLRVKP
jgi:hypothetical protein